MEKLSEMDTPSLEKLRDEIDKELRGRREAQRAEARQKIIELAAAHDIDLVELAATKTGPKTANRYRNPDNQFETWSGRGRQPGWVKAQLAQGRTLQELEAT